MKKYQLTINKSDGTSELVSFTIPPKAGVYTLKFTLSNGEEINAGNIAVGTEPHSYNIKFRLSNGEEIDVGNIETPIAVSFANSTWEEISAISDSGSANTTFKVGDEKTITLANGKEITLVIIGFNHDDISGGGKAGITIGMKDLISSPYSMNSKITNRGGWNDSEMRKSTMEALLLQLPADLHSVIKRVKKKTTNGGKSTSITISEDKLWLFSRVEIDGSTEAGYISEGEQYEYWKTVKDGKNPDDRIKYLYNTNDSKGGWWLRSPSITSISGFLSIDTTGGIYGLVSTFNYYVSFGFCV